MNQQISAAILILWTRKKFGAEPQEIGRILQEVFGQSKETHPPSTSTHYLMQENAGARRFENPTASCRLVPQQKSMQQAL